MPWKETSTLEQRKELIARWQAGDENVAELCREYEISRQTAYKWIRRFERDGEHGLEELSRAPHKAARTMPEKVAELFSASWAYSGLARLWVTAARIL